MALALLLDGCDLNRLGSGLSDSFTTESSLAHNVAKTHESILKEVPLYNNIPLASYVNRIGQRVARATGSPPGSYRFFLLDDPETNAFAVPGGYIYVNRGLLALLGNEDELAAVIGHEIGHLQSGHSAAKIRARGGANVLAASAQSGGMILGVLTVNPFLLFGSMYGGAAASDPLVDALSSGYGREQEFEADKLGAAYANAAGYSPDAAGRAIAKLQGETEWINGVMRARGLTPPPQHGVFDSHPDNVARLQAVTAQAATLKRNPLPPEGDYLAAIDGMRYGLAERMGVQRGDSFYDGFHKQVLVVPKGWFVNQAVENQTVAFTAPQSAALVLFSSQKIVSDLEPQGFVQLYLSGAKVLGVTRTRNGRSEWRGTADIRDLHYEVTGWVEHGASGDLGYLLMGLRNTPAPPAKAAAVAWPQTYENVVAQMRAIRSDEMALAQSLALRVKPADGREKYAQLAVNAPMGVNAESLLRVINGQFPSGEPSKGQRLKVVQ